MENENLLKGKNIMVGITGSIAAFKMCDFVSQLKQMGANVYVIMTKNATKFVSPLTFERLSNNRCVVDTFEKNYNFNIEHISTSKLADLAVIAPASANVIGKIANGIADDMLTTTVNALSCKTFIAPAMNDRMYNNPITQDNIQKLKNYGYGFIDPKVGHLACGDVAIGALADIDIIMQTVCDYFRSTDDFAGKNILITAGPTIEPIDAVRYISNYSSGKMGYAMARMAVCRGAKTTLISGQTNLDDVDGATTIKVKTASDMFSAVKDNIDECDILIMAAAVADYRPKNVSENKLKKGDGQLDIQLVANEDILKWVGQHYANKKFLCGFCMETQNIIEQAKEKLNKKNLDMIVANNLSDKNAGFKYDTNKACIITKNDSTDLPLMSKTELADIILDKISSFF